MTGEFFSPPDHKPEHRCVLPTTFGTHTHWRCDCGKAYVREQLSDRDVNPGELPFQWRRAPKYDSEPGNSADSEAS